MVVLDTLFKVLPNNSFREVFPQLPVMAIIFVEIFFLKIFAVSVSKPRGFIELACFFAGSFFWILLTTVTDAFFLIACLTNLFPSFFFRLNEKKISFFLILWDSMLALLITDLDYRLFLSNLLLRIFNF